MIGLFASTNMPMLIFQNKALEFNIGIDLFAQLVMYKKSIFRRDGNAFHQCSIFQHDTIYENEYQ